MAAFSQRKAVLCTFNRFSGRFCFLHSMSGRNTQREFYNVTSYPPKKELTEVRNGYLHTLILSPGSPNMIFIRLASRSSQNSFIPDLKSSPPPALLLGFSGAIPFCSLATLSFIFPEHMGLIVYAEQAYGACILSFLGAVHWGYTLGKTSELKPNWSTLGYSVTPSLVAWLALLSKPGPGLITLCVGLAFALSKDMSTPYFPTWYYALRKALSTLAISSICITTVLLYLH